MRTRNIAALPLLALLAGGITACNPDATADECTVTDVRLSYHGDGLISGWTAISCTPPPRALSVTVELQHQRTGSTAWSTVSSTGPDRRTPGPTGAKYSVSTHHCSPGTWQMLVTMRGTDDSGAPINIGPLPTKPLTIRSC